VQWRHFGEQIRGEIDGEDAHEVCAEVVHENEATCRIQKCFVRMRRVLSVGHWPRTWHVEDESLQELELARGSGRYGVDF